MSKKKADVYPGARFERLVVLELIPDAENPKALCRCDCGAVITPQRGALRIGKAKSCGCLRREIFLQKGVKHPVEFMQGKGFLL